MKTLILDCNYLGHQAFYTLGELAHDNIHTGVTFGFLSRVISLAELFHTNDIVFCWDSKSSKRKKIFEGYKLRAKTEEEEEERKVLYRQFTLIRRKILPAIGFKNVFLQKGLEADDLMAKLVWGQLGEFVIVTSDEDLFQVLQANTRIYNPTKKIMMTRKRFKKEFGIDSSQWVKVKTIAGCKSDKIPGVGGVGNKTAIRYLNGELTKGKKCEAIQNAPAALLRLNRELTRLPHAKTKEIKPGPNRFSRKGFKSVCEEYGFESFLERKELRRWKKLFKGELNEEI